MASIQKHHFGTFIFMSECLKSCKISKMNTLFIKNIKRNSIHRNSNLMTIKDVDEFVSSSEQIRCIITSLAHQWILCSEWVPSE